MIAVPQHKLHWRYKNLSLLILGSVFGIFIYKSSFFNQLILNLGSFSHLGALFAGILYDTTFTVSASIAMMLILAKTLPYWQLILITTVGAVIGDYLVFKFIKDGLIKELIPIEKALENEVGRNRIHYLKHLFHSRYFHWTLPIVAVIMIGSPLPNEFGISLLGASGIRTKSLLSISLVFNFIGINLILLGSRLWTV